MKKIVIICMFFCSMLVVLSVVSAVSPVVKNKESPLFGIRTKLATSEEDEQPAKESLISKFLGGRLFFRPTMLLFNREKLLPREGINLKTEDIDMHSCEYDYCSFLPCMEQVKNVRDLLQLKHTYEYPYCSFVPCL